jgi:two-component system chemotaxis response regulator CheY
MSILVVDDSCTMRRIIIKSLNRLGFKDCHEASTGREGLERLATTPIDLIITDWHLPEMSGIEFVRAVRMNAAIKHLPVLMVTANAVEDDIVEAHRAGVTTYLVKPFTPDTIRKKIQAALSA